MNLCPPRRIEFLNKNNSLTKFYFNMNLQITPKTKVKELLDVYPELEATLLAMAPEFAKLKNPVLRNTIARITSLQQAAVIGKMDVSVLVNMLRENAGQDPTNEKSNQKQENMKTQKPAWLLDENAALTIDARPMLAAGIHPMNDVFQGLKTLNNGEILKLITGFVPAPLIDKATEKGHETWVEDPGTGEVCTYFCKTHV
jgi:uncharacterized protein (DUF2249 family)